MTDNDNFLSWKLQIELRRWQEIALQVWLTQYRGVVSVVTGGGKTIFAYLCMLAFRQQYPQGRYIIIVPTTALLDQWYVGLREDLNVPQEDIACFSSQEKPEKLSLVNLLVINTARKIAKEIAAEYCTFLIVDECHRAGSPTNALALQGEHQASLGLSATPEREYDEGFQNYVMPALGEIIYRYDYQQAYQDGVISPFELINVRVDLLPDEQERFNKLSKRAAVELKRMQKEGRSDDKLKRLLQQRAVVANSAAMRIPVAAKLAEQHRGQRTLIFHERVDAANLLMNNLSKRKHSVTIYHSNIGSAIRRDNLRLYRRGVFDVLVSCRALDEGMNVPETAVAIIASSTASDRQRIQRLGRVLRPSPGKELATIYTIYATDQEEKRLQNEAQKLEGVASVTWYQGTKRNHG